MVCLKGTYGTDLCSVGHSKEQIGTFNIPMAKVKVNLLELKEKKSKNTNNSETDVNTIDK